MEWLLVLTFILQVYARINIFNLLTVWVTYVSSILKTS